MSDPTFKPSDVAPKSPGEVRETSGRFVNPPTYPQFGGFDGPGKLKKADPAIMTLEK